MTDGGKRKGGVTLNGDGTSFDQELYGGTKAAYDAAIAVNDEEDVQDERERAVARRVFFPCLFNRLLSEVIFLFGVICFLCYILPHSFFVLFISFLQ